MADTDIRSKIEGALKGWIDPHIGTDLVTANAVKDIRVQGRTVEVDVTLGFPAASYQQQLANELKALLDALPEVAMSRVTVDWTILSHAVQQNLKPLPGIKNVIAVASGKGGVGKSTTSVNLALALQAEGASVGILDADMYGPSQPLMLGTKQRPVAKDDKTMDPVMAHGLQSMSIGYLVDEEEPTIWRGPMVTQALNQLLNQTNWDELDYLIIDLPPGTGDTQLSLAQQIPVSGAVIVTTPQDIALLDARKGLKMFEKVNVPVLGVVENMSVHVCSNCGHAEHIFGSGGGTSMAEQYEVPLLGCLPLDISIREQADSGQPTVAVDSNGPIAELYKQVARKSAAELSLKTKDYSHAFPKIVVS